MSLIIYVILLLLLFSILIWIIALMFPQELNIEESIFIFVPAENVSSFLSSKNNLPKFKLWSVMEQNANQILHKSDQIKYEVMVKNKKTIDATFIINAMEEGSKLTWKLKLTINGSTFKRMFYYSDKKTLQNELKKELLSLKTKFESEKPFIKD